MLNYDVLAFIVIANAAATYSLWRRGARKAPGLKRKYAKLLWDSDPIKPKHARPEPPSYSRTEERRFFADFADFGDVVNWWLADEYVHSRWRLQELPDNIAKLRDWGSPFVARCYALFYNQQNVGRLEIVPEVRYGPPEHPQVATDVEIRWARLLPFNAITELLNAIEHHVTDPKPKSVEALAAERAIQLALTKTLWGTHEISKFAELDGQDWSEVKVSFSGNPEWYMLRKSSWRKIMAEDAARAATKRAEATKVSGINRGLNMRGIVAELSSGIKDNIGIAIVIGLTLIYIAFAFFHS